MKKFFVIGLSLMLFACGGKSKVSVGDKTSMKIDLTYDAGKVVKGEVIRAKFKVENTGDFPLVIANVEGSCSCTVADWTKEPIEPGDKGEIKANVVTENATAGEILKSVRVVANTEPSVTNLVIKARIVQK